MKIKVIIHKAEERGYWAEVLALRGCVIQGETFEELLSNIYEAGEACLSVDMKDVKITGKDEILEVAV
jgi:predicted RNase H-like HicB family nuclease